jgi:FkbM family methyltransferase
MRILSFIYKQGLSAKRDSGGFIKLRAKCFRFLRRLILRVADPYCKIDVWGRSMWMPFSHELPGCLATEWHYDQILGRVADFIRASQGPVCSIDVGANIGDTIVALLKDGQDRFLAIEPNPVFFQCLTRNMAGVPNVQLLNSVCSAEDGFVTYNVSTTRGTARFEKADSSGQSFQTNQLDTIVTQFPGFARCNFLKIDTDGHDFDILRGARNLIAEAKPAILFECEMRDNPNYVEDAFEAMKFFAAAGYRYALVYDNDGELFSLLNLDSTAFFPQMLFYQLTGHKCNFDVLVMQDAEIFIQKELEFFVNAVSSKESRTAAQNAAKLMMAQLTRP